MSCYLCSNETISIVADVVSTNFNVEVEEAFKELLDYNVENLKIRYDDVEWGQENSHYVEVDCSEAQKIKSIRNYLYQTDDYVTNYLIEWLQKYSEENYHLIEEATEKLYWDYELKQYDEDPVEPVKTPKQLYFERGLDVVEIAKRIRKDLKEHFKGSKFSVTTKRFSGGQSITIVPKEVKDELTYTYEELYDKGDLDRLQYDNPPVFEYLNKLYKEVKIIREEVENEIKAIADKYNYCESDPYTDYYDVGFYLTVRNEIK